MVRIFPVSPSFPYLNHVFVRGLLFLPATLAFVSSLFILSYIPSTTKLFVHLDNTHLIVNPPLEFFTVTPPAATANEAAATARTNNSPPEATKTSAVFSQGTIDVIDQSHALCSNSSIFDPHCSENNKNDQAQAEDDHDISTLSVPKNHDFSNNNTNSETIISIKMPEKITLKGDEPKQNSEDDVFHDAEIFHENYKEMNSSLKIYIYPHKKDDPFANVLLPVGSEPGGNYASESYFKKALMKSHFVTKNPSEANLFFLPFSITSLRNDKRIGVGGIQGFVKDYVYNVSQIYPFWNRSGGADHFYVACHSIGRSAMDKAVYVKLNAIQVVCSSSYFLPGYISHKDASVPQIWPRKGEPPKQELSTRTKLAFFAGAMNSRVRNSLVRSWKNDSEIFVHHGRMKTPYSEALMSSKYCIHAKGFEVNTARIGDALYYGCVPIIMADHYDLPYADILDWNTFSVVVSTYDIPLLKKILLKINNDGYLRLQNNVVKVRRHFQWHHVPINYDAFYMVMYELWLRRSHVRLLFL